MDDKNKTRIIKKKNSFEIIIFGLLLVMITLSAVMMLRMSQDKPLFPVGESYYSLRISETLQHQPLLRNDPVQERLYNPNTYHYVLAGLFNILPQKQTTIFLPLILGVLNAFLFYSLLRLLRIKKLIASLSIIVIAASPAFITTFTGLYTMGFALLLSLVSLLLIFNPLKAGKTLAAAGWICKILGVLAMLLLSLTSLTAFIITLAAGFLIRLYLKNNQLPVEKIKNPTKNPIKNTQYYKSDYKHTLCALWLLLGFGAIINAVLYLTGISVPLIKGFHGFAFRNVLSVLRADTGFSIFLLLIFLTGFAIAWSRTSREKWSKTRMFHFALLLLVILAFFNTVVRLYASMAIAVYCVVAAYYFYSRKWQLQIVKTGTLLLIICSLIFSLFNQAAMLVAAQPDQDMVSLLEDIETESNGSAAGAVLTLEQYGFIIEYYSGTRTVIDQHSYLYADYDEKRNDINELFDSARLKDAEPYLREHGIRYVLLTSEMKELLWSSRQKGLWFLMLNSESFIKNQQEQSIELWEYSPADKPS